MKHTCLKVKKIIICCYSAGGANVVASFIKVNNLIDQCRFILDGPAVKCFEEILGLIKNENFDILHGLETQNTVVLTGSSGSPSWERNCLKKTNEDKLYSICFLDHWGHFKKRFIPNELWDDNNAQAILPTRIWVADQYTLDLAISDGLPKNIIEIIGNPYLQLQKEIFSQIEIEISLNPRILFISEYFSLENDDITIEENSSKEVTEFSYIENILSELEKNSLDFHFTLRLHPNESKDKYEYLHNTWPWVILSKGDTTLLEDMSRGDIIIGRTSMALNLAAHLNKTTFSYVMEGMSLPPENDGVKVIHNIKDILQEMINPNEL